MLVQVAAAKGSTPREAGTAMLVTAQPQPRHDRRRPARVGGDPARPRDAGERRCDQRRSRMPLGPAVGQCCGGNVTLEPAARRRAPTSTRSRRSRRGWRSACPRCCCSAPATSAGRSPGRSRPCRCGCAGSTTGEHEFPEPAARGPRGRPDRAPARRGRGRRPPGAAYFVMTYSHGLDFEICEAVLRRGDFAYLGLIGSRSKRARFEHGWRELGLDEALIARLVCPIGGPLRDKRPPVIAALAAAQVLHALAAAAAERRPDRRPGRLQHDRAARLPRRRRAWSFGASPSASRAWSPTTAVSFKVAPGEIHALLGENGAGKSTLVKIIYGVLHADEGSMLWEGRPVQVADPHAARAARHRHGVPALLAVRGDDGARERRARRRRHDRHADAREEDPARSRTPTACRSIPRARCTRSRSASASGSRSCAACCRARSS